MNKVILLALLHLSLSVKAQVKITGTVSTNREAIGWANVFLTHADGSLITGGLTREDGSFELEAGKGSYKIKISFLGFNDWEENIILGKDTSLGTITLHAKEDKLGEVSIVSKKSLVEYKPDRLLFHVENSIAASGGSALNAIAAAPGVIVQNNTISILGKSGSRIMIDGRIIALSGEELTQYLSSLQASDIKSIEVISNPPAQYEAAGAGGLINIILKKGAKNAWKNNTSLSYNQSAYSFFNGNNSLYYHKNKFRFSILAGGQAGYLKTKEYLDTDHPNGLRTLESTGKQKQDNLSAGLSFDYDISDRTTAGFQYLGNYSNPDRKDKTVIGIYNTGSTLDSLLINNGFNNLNTSSNSYNAHLITRLDTLGRKLTVDVDHFKYSSGTNNNFTANMYLPDGSFGNTNQSARNISDQNISNTSIKADMEHPLKTFNLTYGARISFSSSNAGIQYYNTLSGEAILDPLQSNQFEYHENNQSVYVNATRALSSRLNLQVGLRLENTQTQGHSATLDQIHKNNYLKLFPTLYLSYKADEQHNLLFNYGRRINRPGFRDLNPFRSYLNSNSYSEGNPFLQPSYNDNFDFTYVYKERLSTNLFFNITTNGFGILFSADPKTAVQIISRQNYFREYFYGIGESYTADISPWWQSQSQIYLLGSQTRFINAIDARPDNNIQVYLSTNNSFSLGTTTKLQVDFFYNTPAQRGLYKTGYISGWNIGIKQSLLHKKLQLALLVNDVLNTAWLKNYTSVVNGIKQVYSQNNSSRFFRLSLTYSFGNHKINNQERNFGNDEERKRAN